MIDFSGKIALVTGAGIGIGRASALALARHGADVALAYLSSGEEAATAAREITALGRKAVTVRGDVSNDVEVQALVTQVEQQLGPVDILVNNAGWAYQQPLDDITEADWDAVLDTNLKSAFLVTRAVLPHMREAGWGRVVNVGSGAASTGGLMGLHYATAKAGLEGLTRAFASRLVKEGITVNIVAPMLIHTGEKRDNEARKKIVPMGRQGTPEEVADAVVLCAGTEFMTGQSVHMNGGVYYH